MQIRKVLLIIKLSLVLLLCFVIFRAVIMPQHPVEIFTPVSAAAGTENINMSAVENTTDTSVGDYSAIVERNIFGGRNTSYEASLPVGKSGGAIRLAGEELGLTLVGTICGSTVVSRAIIKDNKTNLLNLYKTGQNVAGTRIDSIEENAVVLIHNGQKKMLKLNRTNENNMPIFSPIATGRAGETIKPDFSAKQPPAEIPTKMAHVVEILAKADIEPYVVNEQVEGLKVTGLDNIPMAKLLGLKEGDVISVINGHKLTSKQKALQVLKKARSQQTMSMELSRNGESKELTFNLW